jgi:4-aminobutyrate aminotransferase/(S)-3-amino-2-methylpropionate transaminase
MIEEEGLVERSQQIGRVLITLFRSWQQRFEQIGDVRGLGSMVAMEFVKDRDTKEPDKELTAKIIAAAQQKGLILLSAGLYGNCIRILVPLVITDEQLEEGLNVLESVLNELLSQPARIEN